MSPDPRVLAEIVRESAEQSGVAGVQVSVVTPDGRQDVAWGQAGPATTLATSHHIQVGSIAKVLTAVLVHQLVDDGLLSLDDDVDQVARASGDRDLVSVTGVTVGQLLSMTSGLDWGIWAPGDTVAEALRAQLALPRRATDRSFGYSFASTLVSARLVELLRGETWWRSVVDRIARPLHLDFSEAPDSPGFSPRDGVWSEATPGALRGMGPTGTTLAASAADLATLGASLGDPNSPLLSAKSRTTLHSPVVEVGAAMCADRWCYGPYSRTAGDVVLHGHGGRWAGGVSDLTWQADTGTAVAIVTNTPERGGDLVRLLSSAIHPMLWGAESFVATTPVDAADPGEIDALVGRYSTASRVYDVRRIGTGLRVEATSRPVADAVFLLPDSRDDLRRVGGRRFLPAEETREECRLQEYWFSAEPTPRHFYDGFVAARRE